MAGGQSDRPGGPDAGLVERCLFRVVVEPPVYVLRDGPDVFVPVGSGAAHVQYLSRGSRSVVHHGSAERYHAAQAGSIQLERIRSQVARACAADSVYSLRTEY